MRGIEAPNDFQRLQAYCAVAVQIQVTLLGLRILLTARERTRAHCFGWARTIVLKDPKRNGEYWFSGYLKSRINPAVIFDVGADVGDYSRKLREVLPNTRIYAFEPGSKAQAALRTKISPT